MYEQARPYCDIIDIAVVPPAGSLMLIQVYVAVVLHMVGQQPH